MPLPILHPFYLICFFLLCLAPAVTALITLPVILQLTNESILARARIRVCTETCACESETAAGAAWGERFGGKHVSAEEDRDDGQVVLIPSPASLSWSDEEKRSGVACEKGDLEMGTSKSLQALISSLKNELDKPLDPPLQNIAPSHLITLQEVTITPSLHQKQSCSQIRKDHHAFMAATVRLLYDIQELQQLHHFPRSRNIREEEENGAEGSVYEALKDFQQIWASRNGIEYPKGELHRAVIASVPNRRECAGLFCEE
ncbi:hypothetical protein BP5796_08982 [Coleophoma crateriformis]|uniref:Uncharacterized protein n=1 Tax=Coleophoma crateriformis TaxID=565419 RepID=A0A3D8R2P5_9HELO|nr:hypothetical protein BP5796_08982 [Coleophoma crateriformis]